MVEYMVFKNKDNLEKCTLIKLKNQTKDIIHKVDFEIKQYNNAADLIYKACYSYTNLNILPNHEFTPTEKFKVQDEFEYIEYRLISMETPSKQWKEATWIDLEETHTQSRQNPLSIKRIYHKDLKFPYAITFVIVLMFVISLIAVFVMINT